MVWDYRKKAGPLKEEGGYKPLLAFAYVPIKPGKR